MTVLEIKEVPFPELLWQKIEEEGSFNLGLVAYFEHVGAAVEACARQTKVTGLDDTQAICAILCLDYDRSPESVVRDFPQFTVKEVARFRRIEYKRRWAAENRRSA